MEGLERICFEMIASNGSARSYFMEAIGEAKKGKFDEAVDLIKEGEEMLAIGHHHHGKLLSKEASGEKVEVDLLLVHAEDQMMSAETFRIIAKEMIEIYKRLEK